MGLRPNDLNDEDFIRKFVEAGCSPTRMSEDTGLAISPIYRRLNALRDKGHDLPTIPLPGAGGNKYAAVSRAYHQRLPIDFRDGVAVVFSDAHWWPGVPRTVSHEALLSVIRTIKPGLIVANGDVFDGAAISRHPPQGWSPAPKPMDELETVKEHMAAIAKAARGAVLLRTIGNHDMRFDQKLAAQVPDYRHLAGMQLRDHLPAWQEAWCYEINGAVMVKHRWHNGIHAAHNNAVKSGRSIITSHLHRLQVVPWTDYNGRRWGVDTGTLSEPAFQQFDYSEDNPKNWGSGFAVLTFRRGELLPPEMCEVIRGAAYFRGRIVHEQARDHQPHPRAGETPAGAGDRKPDRVPVLRRGMDGDQRVRPAAHAQVPVLRKKAGGKAR